jgi:DNA-binding NtrC family response regulator
VEGVTPEALVALEAYAWPGNVRELQNSVFRAVVSARGPFLTTADFPDLSPDRVPRYLPRPYPPRLDGPAPAGAPAPLATPGLNAFSQLVTMEDHERAAIQQALDLSSGNVRAAADRLQVARSTLYRRIRALGLLTAAS